MTTIELIESVRELVRKHRAVRGHVSSNRSLYSDATRDHGYWHIQIWFDNDQDCVAVNGDTTDGALLGIVRELDARRGDPIKSRDVMSDEIDEDPSDEVTP